jgi:hypothetical protein
LHLDSWKPLSSMFLDAYTLCFIFKMNRLNTKKFSCNTTVADQKPKYSKPKFQENWKETIARFHYLLRQQPRNRFWNCISS